MHRQVSVAATLPEDIDALTLVAFDGYRRSELLHSPDGSATVADNSLRPTNLRHRRLQLVMDVGRNLPQRDRAYAPFLRFGDGTVAVDSDLLAAAPGAPALCLRFLPPPGEQVIGFGRASRGPLTAPITGNASGYVAFGHPRIEGTSPMQVIDRTVPAWARQRLGRTIDQLAQFYRKRLGPAPLPVVLIYRMPYPPGGTGTGYHGDRLVGSLTLGLLGSDPDWRAPSPAILAMTTGFVAHEMFHVWNLGDHVRPADDGEASLASEGGAEFARLLATAILRGGGQRDWLAAVGQSLNACLLALPDRGSLAGNDLAHGKLPYDCGVPMMLTLAIAANPRDPVAGYFSAWRHLIIARPTEANGYDWSDLARKGTDPRLLRALHAAVDGDRAYPDAIQQALRLTGFTVSPEHHPAADMRRQLNLKLVAALVSTDCGGRINLWNHPDGFLTGTPLPGCRTLQAGKLIDTVLGKRLNDDDPIALRDALQARCNADEEVTVGYAGHPNPVRLACPPHWPAMTALWRIEVAAARPEVGD